MKVNIVWIPFVFLLSHHAIYTDGDIHSMLRQLDIEENDPDITQSEKEKLDEYRNTLIKQEILKMLGLENPPNVSHIPQMPKEMIKSVLHQTKHHRKGGRKNQEDTSKQIIVIAEPGMIIIPLHLISYLQTLLTTITLSLSWINKTLFSRSLMIHSWHRFYYTIIFFDDVFGQQRIRPNEERWKNCNSQRSQYSLKYFNILILRCPDIHKKSTVLKRRKCK